QILQLALEQSRVTLSSVDTIKHYHPLRLPLLPMIQRKIGEEVWTKLEFGHRRKLEYAAVLDPVSENLRRNGTRHRQGPRDLLSFGRLNLLKPLLQLRSVPEFPSQFSRHELSVSRETFGRDVDPA